jgi:putative intracellular protease/amidase
MGLNRRAADRETGLRARVGAAVQMTMTKPAAYASDLRAVILPADKFEDIELLVLQLRLLDAGICADIAGPTMEPIGGEHGYRIEPDLTIDAVGPDDDDVLIVPGGFPGRCPGDDA